MSFLRLEIASPFAEIIIDRPDKRNALSLDMWADIPGLVAQANAHEDVKLILLHGGTTGHFAAGADISEFSTRYADDSSASQSGGIIGAALTAVETSPKPVIAVIDGDCIGGGVSLSVAADIRIAGCNIRMGITPAKLGLVYPPVDTRLLLRAVGTSTAKDLLFTGRLVGADEAKDIGLIDQINTTDASTLDFAKAYAEQITRASQWSVRAIKTMIKGLDSGWPDDGADATAIFLEGFRNADHLEGRAAFLEKRKARFPIK